MGYGSEVVRICRLSNGWELEIFDPAPEEVKAEQKAAAKGDCCVPSAGIYKDPWRTMAFSTFEDMIEFLEEKGPTLKPRNFDDEYAKSFAATIKSMSAADDEVKEKKK